MDTITTLEQLDAKLLACEQALKKSDSAMRDVFASFRMDISTQVPSDPFSSEYMDFQMQLYRRISGKDYAPKNEKTKFNVADADRRPFPYYTGSSRTSGFFTMGVGFLLYSLDLAPSARVLEFGAGWGNTTIAMAMIGMDVTAVDIEPDFCELLKLRAKRQELNITVVNADFLWAETVTDPYDAVVFFECFHHCSDHRRLLAALDAAVKPDGRVYFAAEPIVADFPVPWGLRMDGESLWAIRQNGWLELGFREDYFREALARAGWSVHKHVFPDIGWAAVWEARRAETAAPGVADGLSPPIIPRAIGPIMPDPDPAPLPVVSSEAAALRLQLEAVYNSTSWKLTAPLRALKRRLAK